MKTVREAQDYILERTGVQGVEEVSINNALGRGLAQDVFSNRNHPPSDISAMDGYAVIASDLLGATKDNPAILEIIDDIRAGVDPKCAVSSTKTSRIMTGAAMPEGADTVIRVEDTDCNGTHAKIFIESKKGANVRLFGENLKVDDKVLDAGTEITPACVGILAMVKKTKVTVYKRPRIAILSTGDELEGLDEPFDPKKIPDANSHTVMASLQAAGVEPVMLGIARDTPESLAEKLTEGLKYDALIVSGGVSVGHHDFVRPTLKKLGVEMHFWRVALRPGHPFALGMTTDNKPVFALPGNPVSSMVCCEEFIVPSVRKMMGLKNLFRRTISATLSEDVKDKKGRVHFMRAFVADNDADDGGSGYTARLTGSQGSGILMSMVEADGLLIMPASNDFLKAGSIVRVQPLHGFAFQQTPGLPAEPEEEAKKKEKENV